MQQNKPYLHGKITSLPPSAPQIPFFHYIRGVNSLIKPPPHSIYSNPLGSTQDSPRKHSSMEPLITIKPRWRHWDAKYLSMKSQPKDAPGKYMASKDGILIKQLDTIGAIASMSPRQLQNASPTQSNSSLTIPKCQQLVQQYSQRCSSSTHTCPTQPHTSIPLPHHQRFPNASTLAASQTVFCCNHNDIAATKHQQQNQHHTSKGAQPKYQAHGSLGHTRATAERVPLN